MLENTHVSPTAKTAFDFSAPTFLKTLSPACSTNRDKRSLENQSRRSGRASSFSLRSVAASS
jgi:hypothetical protein